MVVARLDVLARLPGRAGRSHQLANTPLPGETGGSFAARRVSPSCRPMSLVQRLVAHPTLARSIKSVAAPIASDTRPTSTDVALFGVFDGHTPHKQRRSKANWIIIYHSHILAATIGPRCEPTRLSIRRRPSMLVSKARAHVTRAIARAAPLSGLSLPVRARALGATLIRKQ